MVETAGKKTHGCAEVFSGGRVRRPNKAALADTDPGDGAPGEFRPPARWRNGVDFQKIADAIGYSKGHGAENIFPTKAFAAARGEAAEP